MIRSSGRCVTWSSTSRVPSVEPSLTTRISRGAGRSIAISRRITSATVRASLYTGTTMDIRCLKAVAVSLKDGSCVEERRLHGRGLRAVALDLADRHADIHRLGIELRAFEHDAHRANLALLARFDVDSHHAAK